MVRCRRVEAAGRVAGRRHEEATRLSRVTASACTRAGPTRYPSIMCVPRVCVHGGMEAGFVTFPADK
ncbi:hypothetical protein FAGKG844_90042 [Frankia sp. AgKG'84/4]